MGLGLGLGLGLGFEIELGLELSATAASRASLVRQSARMVRSRSRSLWRRACSRDGALSNWTCSAARLGSGLGLGLGLG